MITKRSARRIRGGIAAGRRQARFEKQYSLGGTQRWDFPGDLDARDGAPTNSLGSAAYWYTIMREHGGIKSYSYE